MQGASLDGQVAVISGGAGGIGSAICHRLAAEGATIVATAGSRLGRAEDLIASLPGSGHFAVLAPVDDPQRVTAMEHTVRDRLGRIDILVNGAGITRAVAHEDLDALDDELIDRVFQVNWRGAFAMVRALQPLLSAGDGGVIVNISSIAGVTGVGSNIAYCASKAALDSMTRSLARCLAPEVRVVSVSPGVVRGEYAQSLPAAWLEAQEKATPTGRLATPEDVADAVAAVIGLRSTTGAVLPVDGGRPLGR
jgi:3-oxoacyl-[acyl-carrier protein] reductase